MRIGRHHIEVGGIAIEVDRKDIKHLHVGVYPPGGRVRVSTPLQLDDDAVRLAIVARLPWIRRCLADFERQVRQSERDMTTGESHYFRGRRYRLDVIGHDGPPSVALLNNSTIAMRIRLQADRDQREAVLRQWYRESLRAQIPPLLAKWEPAVGVTVAEARIKRMKTRWGSCNAAARRIWLNLELAKKPPACLEYILVHEMVHFIERHHNQRFRERMDALMPTWRHHRDALNRAPLAHEDWAY